MTARPDLATLSRRCQKLDHRRLGNWMARHVARPAALRITWLVLPWGVSAHAVTLAAWCVGLAAAVLFAGGSAGTWLAAAILLQLWYLLDHVDGQLARYHNTESLDGVALDYLMHHSVHLAVPLGIGQGLAQWGSGMSSFSAGDPLVVDGLGFNGLGLNGLMLLASSLNWSLLGPALGALWAMGLLLLALEHDVRYKAFFQRLKLVEGTLLVAGGGGGRPTPPAPLPRSWRRRLAWLARKSCEIHVTMNLLLVVGLLAWLAGDRHLLLGRAYVLLAVPLAALTAWVTIVRALGEGRAEAAFSAWFRVPPGSVLVHDGHWWRVEPQSDVPSAERPPGVRDPSIEPRTSPSPHSGELRKELAGGSS